CSILFRMKESVSKVTSFTVGPEGARLLTNPKALNYIGPFLVGPHTLTTAAGVLGVAPSTIAYWIPRFLGAGLIRETVRQRRAGMASPLYEAVAESFSVPLELLDPIQAERFISGGRAMMLDRVSRALIESTLGRELALVLSADSAT